MSVRINELAKDLNLPSKDVLDWLSAEGVEGKIHSSSLDVELVEKVKQHFGPAAAQAEAPVAPAPPGNGGGEATAGDAPRPMRKVMRKVIKRLVRRVPAPEGDAAPAESPEPETAAPVAAHASHHSSGDRDENAIARAIRARLMRRHGTILKPRPQPPPPEPEPPSVEAVTTAMRSPSAAVPAEAVAVAAPGEDEIVIETTTETPGGVIPGPPSAKALDEADRGRKKKKEVETTTRRGKRTPEVKGRRKSKLLPPRETLAEALQTATDDEPAVAAAAASPVAPAVNPAVARRAAQIVSGGGGSGRGPSRKRSYRRTKRQRNYQAETAREEAEERARTTLKIHEATTVGDLAAGLNITPGELLTKLFGMGVMATVNQQLDRDAIAIIADEYNFEIEESTLYEASDVFHEEEDQPEDLKPRPPVVTIMGHVDHGKTKLLDALRKTNVVDGEVGGITQKISAFRTRMNDRDIVFLDTPGHEAFAAMRARGAQATDLVVLVVAANDGVMPQTVEAVHHARASEVPIVVAVNKIDLPDANGDRIKQQLSEHGLTPEDWGGQTQFVQVSALKRLGLDDLLESILLQADLLELKANPKPMGRGIVIEARLDQGRGAVATVLIRKGTVSVGDPFVAGGVHGRVRAMFNDQGSEIQKAGPSTPVEILGFSGVPESGDRFIAVASEKEARDFAVKLQHLQRARALKPMAHMSLESLAEQVQEGRVKELNVILKGDVQGSVEALNDSLLKLSTEKVRVVIRHSGVGAVSESDVYLADTTDSLIIGFSVSIAPDAQKLSNSLGVNIRIYEIIFNVLEDVRSAMSGLLEKKIEENVLGHCEVREVFRRQRTGSVAGCYVTDGKMLRNARVRVVGGDTKVKYEGQLTTLRRFKDDVREVATGYECGVGFDHMVDFQEGDKVECFELLEVTQTL